MYTLFLYVAITVITTKSQTITSEIYRYFISNLANIFKLNRCDIGLPKVSHDEVSLLIILVQFLILF